MVTVEKKRKYTVDDYMLLEEGAPFQLINYELIMSPSPTTTHQFIVSRITKLMLVFLEDQNLGGYAAGTIDVLFDSGNVFQPDFVYVAEERVAEIVKKHIEGSPDMVIEILSPSNARYDLRQKKGVYEKYGVKEYIVFDPVAKAADLYVLRNGSYYLYQHAQNTEILNSVVLCGFAFDLNYLFK